MEGGGVDGDGEWREGGGRLHFGMFEVVSGERWVGSCFREFLVFLLLVVL